MSARILVLISLPLLAFLLAACDASSKNNKPVADERDDIVCPAIAHPAVEVFVFDDVTKEPISCGATLLIGDGDFSVTVTEVGLMDLNYQCLDRGSLRGAEAREGTYTLVISKPGYVDYVITDVVVGRGDCGIATARFDIYMEPLE